MKSRVLIPALAAVSLMAAPVAAQAATVERTAAPTAEQSELGGSYLWIIAVIAAIVAGILLLDDNEPDSP
jgi:heme/copper-type cytochrome/quinol oxidase subunit 2